MAPGSDVSADRLHAAHETNHLAGRVMFRVFDDGVVVYVAETCETHLFPCEYRELFEALAAAHFGAKSGFDRCPDTPPAAAVLRDTPIDSIDELIRMKILERAH